MRIRIGFNVSAPLLYGLSWILLGLAALMVLLAIATALGMVDFPMPVSTDLIGAVICALLGLLFRSLAGRIDHTS